MYISILVDGLIEIVLMKRPVFDSAFCLPSVTGTPGLLKEADVALTRGKTIRIARALLVTAGSEGSDRK